MDSFERELQRQPLKPLPADCREAVLRAVRAAGLGETNEKQPAPVLPWWREWLWPSPRAWAALGAVWIVIAVLRATTPHASSPLAQAVAAPTSSSLAEQRRELARWLETTEAGSTEAAPVRPGPRSERSVPPRA